MYQTFTGHGRRPRQVNLSGKPSNPFASTLNSGAQQAIASAQQDRILRQQRRERIQASSRIQRTWRGHESRRRTFGLWREIWDQQEERENGAYPSEDQSLQQLRRLLLFYSPTRESKDIERLIWYGTRQSTTEVKFGPRSPWPSAYKSLQAACLAALKVSRDHDSRRTLLCILAYAAQHVRFTSADAAEYYLTLTDLLEKNLPLDPLQGALLAPLEGSGDAYAGLSILLSRPLKAEMLSLLKSSVDAPALSDALSRSAAWKDMDLHSRLWLLGNMIYVTGRSNDIQFTKVVVELLGSLADDVDFEGQPIQSGNSSFGREIADLTTGIPLNTYLHSNIGALVDQQSVRNLIINERAKRDDSYAQILASYALTLLRCFPRKADDIRMWLYRGPSNPTGTPATQYLWSIAKNSHVFASVLTATKNVLPVLKPSSPASDMKDDWTVILVFMELYTFILKILDDEEFMGSNVDGKQKNPVATSDVVSLVTFLKNLGFTLYFNADELNESETSSAAETTKYSLSHHFRPSRSPNVVHLETKPMVVAGIPGLTVVYLKGLVTGLLRALYERDSRRQFLPKDHWLMTDRFDMQSFIPGVVAEEEKRHMVQEQEDNEDNVDSEDELYLFDSSSHNNRIHDSHARALRAQNARERAQRKASRKRYLESVAPRLEILQNMPFFIPFHMRVQIFRQFVTLDQEKRRNGFVDPDMWRQSMLMHTPMGTAPQDMLAKHHATIKRGQEFHDAYQSFYDLGPALKEPIMITFVDGFDMPEAGIDGGGVTKEFLTSVITQAFDQSSDAAEKYFVENDKHLLYPNPVAMEEIELKYRTRVGDSFRGENARETKRELERELLRQYDFLGRVIGKCLYEGMLVDVTFAGFFLKKWALTGGTGSASMESGYRASINDLRELDEGLYRGLLALKNAENAEDIGAVFAVDDTVGPPGKQQIIQTELVENGAETAVTNENRLAYINYLSRYKLQRQSWRQTNAFLRGLSLMIQPSWLSMFNQTELQTLIGGASASIDVEDLRRNTAYGGVYVVGDDGLEHPSVQMFWRVMHDIADEDRRKVLKFVTSTPRGPLLGFSYLKPLFSIRDSGSDENRFPTTSTCVNLLKLPMYKSESTLRAKLLAAVNSGAGFDLS
jgi:ubiquitin-protein ligase E3 C